MKNTPNPFENLDTFSRICSFFTPEMYHTMLCVNHRFLTWIGQTPWARKQRDFWQKNPQHASHLQIIFTLTNIKSAQPHFGIFANASGQITRWAHVGDQVLIHKQPINPSQKWVCDVLDLRHLPSLTEAKLQQLSMQQKNHQVPDALTLCPDQNLDNKRIQNASHIDHPYHGQRSGKDTPLQFNLPCPPA